MLSKVKDPVIYKVSCLCGDFYIRQIGTSVNTRMKEQKVACRLVRFKRSAVAEHACQDGHIIEGTR